MGVAGNACQCCAEKPTRGAPQPVLTQDKQPSTGRTAKKGLENAAHEGQKRANLTVKDGGFSLKNFAASNKGNIEDCYTLSKVVGEGAFGTVRKGEDKSTKAIRAVKSVNKSATKEVQRLSEEIAIVAVLDHPNIVRLYESFEDRKCIYLVLELCEGGELFDRIVDMGHFSEAVAAMCVKQMLMAINYLHQNYIMHRDLKPENWLVATKDPVEKSTLKLIDFGISKRFRPGEPVTSKAGTPNYVAPEVLVGRYTEKVDIWSTGVITYIMLCGQQPFVGKGTDDILTAVTRAKVSLEGVAWRKVSNNAKGLIKTLLQKSPEMRPTAVRALSHTWFSSGALAAQGSDFSMGKLEIDSLRSFSRMNKVKKAALTIVATQLSDQRIDNLKNMFVGIDRNHDGTLSIAELKQGLKLAGVKIPKDLGQVLEQVDTDGSGVLDYTEFIAATMDKKICNQESVVWAAFRKFDVDGSGSIDVKELAKVLGDEEMKEQMQLAGDPHRLEEVFNEIDVNGDGVIDFEEFFAMVRTAEDDARETAFKKKTDGAISTDLGAASVSARSFKSRGRSVESPMSASRSVPSRSPPATGRSPRRSRGKPAPSGADTESPRLLSKSSMPQAIAS